MDWKVSLFMSATGAVVLRQGQGCSYRDEMQLCPLVLRLALEERIVPCDQLPKHALGLFSYSK